MNRGDVVLVRFPHPSGLRGKKRPAVIVQANAYTGVVGTLVVAEVTSNLTMARDPACLFSDTTEPTQTSLTSTSEYGVLCLTGMTSCTRPVRLPSQTITALFEASPLHLL